VSPLTAARRPPAVDDLKQHHCSECEIEVRGQAFVFQLYKKRTETAKKEYLKQLAAYRASLVSQVLHTHTHTHTHSDNPSPGHVTGALKG